MVKTKKKLIPALRFPEFEGEWEEKKLGEVSKVTSGGTPNRSKSNFWGGKIPWITTSLINFNKIISSDEFITKEGLENSSAKIFPIGTLLLAMYGQGKTRGKISILGIEASTNQACGAIIPNKLINNNFLFHNLTRRYNEIRGMSNDGGQKNISGGIIKNLLLTYPPLPEQQKIANFLKAIDSRLQGLAKKKNLLESYKKGIMQKIFAQEIRFKDENGKDFPAWEEKRLGEVCKITTGSSNRIDSSLDAKYTFFDRSQDVRSSNIYLFDGEAIIIAGEGQEFIPKYFMGKFDLHQRTYAIMDFKENKGKYIYYLIDKNRNYFISQAVGSTVKSLRLPIFKKMKIPFPSLKEQKKIAAFLSSIDKKIELLGEQIQKTKTYKKGLLQKMFV